MSTYYKPLTISKKHKDLNWMNALVTLHDLNCQCDEPLQHTIDLILEKEPTIIFKPETTEKLKKCLTTTAATTQDVVDDFGDGELEKLFDQDTFGEEDTDG